MLSRRRLGTHFFAWQFYEGFQPDACIIGKMLQCPALVVLGDNPRFRTARGGSDKTKWNPYDAMRCVHLLRYLVGEVQVKPLDGTASAVEHFRSREEAPELHTICRDALTKHWGPDPFTRGEIWGCGGIWFFNRPIFVSKLANNVYGASLDAEPYVRVVLPYRPKSRLIPYLESTYRPMTDRRRGSAARSGGGTDSKGASGGGASADRVLRSTSARRQQGESTPADGDTDAGDIRQGGADDASPDQMPPPPEPKRPRRI